MGNLELRRKLPEFWPLLLLLSGLGGAQKLKEAM
jgi:hypothetical protein